jgi:hypothetical protein
MYTVYCTTNETIMHGGYIKAVVIYEIYKVSLSRFIDQIVHHIMTISTSLGCTCKWIDGK